jgi:DNA-binding response OmpR family regulator
MQILIVEDEPAIREVQKAYLLKAGYRVHESGDGEQALQLFQQHRPNLIVLDLNLPSRDGIQICKQIRLTSQVPIIMVTARTEEMDELIGLEIGADDYIKKPFSPNVLVARVNALLRRQQSGTIVMGSLTIDPQKMVVSKSGQKLSLTTTQFNILYSLASKPGRVFTRDEILDNAYSDIMPDVLDRTIDAHVKAIRKVIEDDPAIPYYVLTVIGKGYKFNDELENE